MVAKRPWTPEEMSKMVELKNSKIAVPKIAAEIGRSPAAIYVRLSQMQRAKLAVFACLGIIHAMICSPGIFWISVVTDAQLLRASMR